MIEQVVLKPENRPEQLRILANDLMKEYSVQEQLEKASGEDCLVGRILAAV
jgi:hypothetical protein